MGQYYRENYPEYIKIEDVELPCACNVQVSDKGKKIVSHNGIHEQTGWNTAKISISGRLEGKDEADLNEQIKSIIAIGRQQEALSIISRETEAHNISKIVLEDDPKITLIDGFDLSRNLLIEGVEDQESEMTFDLVKKKREDIKRITDPKKKQPKDIYVVTKGDTLSGIAKKEYGNFQLWRVIYAENQNIIGSNPNLIKPGQELVIPKLSTENQEHKIAKGDSYTSLAKKFYKDVVYRKHITKANDTKDLVEGATVTIPPLKVY